MSQDSKRSHRVASIKKVPKLRLTVFKTLHEPLLQRLTLGLHQFLEELIALPLCLGQYVPRYLVLDALS